MILREVLLSWGCRPEVAASGAEALARLLANPDDDPFGLVLLDQDMPGMDGEQTARAIKAAPRYAAVPLVLLASLGAPDGGGGRGRPLGRAADEADPPLAALQRPLPGRRGPRLAPRPAPGRRRGGDDAALAPPHPPGRGQRGQSPGGDRHGRAARLPGRGRRQRPARRSRRSTTAGTTSS